MKLLNSLITALTVCISLTHASAQEPRSNVLFICIDDMNDWLGFLNTHPQVKTPYLDKLASEGYYFTNAHCPAPICGPSRTSVLSGLWPSTSGIYTNAINYREDMAGHISLPAYFRKHGYHSLGMGKIFHSGASRIPEDAFQEYGGKGASAQPFNPADLQLKKQIPFHRVILDGKSFDLPLNGMPADRYWGTNNTFDWGAVDVADSLYDDTRTANWTIQKLGETFDKPFFIATGFTRPHQPLYNPKRFHDLYPLDSVQLPPTRANDLADVPRAGKEYALAASTSGLHKTVKDYDEWHHAVSSYLASISYVDDLIGGIMAALKKSAHADNTIVVIWSDHGWHLGEKEHWGKETGWLRSTRVPLIIIPAKNTRSSYKKKNRINQVVNLIDLGPTLAELCRLPALYPWEGRSVVPLLKNDTTNWDNHTQTTFGYGNHSISTAEWQYIRYFDGTEELYDLQQDPHQFTNLANKVLHQERIKDFKKLLPDEENYRHFVRYKNFKALVPEDGSDLILFNLAFQNHINQKTNVATQYPRIVTKIEQWLTNHQPTKKCLHIKSGL